MVDPGHYELLKVVPLKHTLNLISYVLLPLFGMLLVSGLVTRLEMV